MASALTLCTCQTDRQTDTDKTGDILQRLCTRLIRDRQTTDRQVTYHRGDGLGSDIVHVADCQVDVHLPVTHQTADDLPQGAHQPASGGSVTGGDGEGVSAQKQQMNAWWQNPYLAHLLVCYILNNAGLRKKEMLF